ncbi:hypothetical protein Q644_02140 [Brucella intermedia 229E]|uniref:Uncharacterized protein n=1 Tax=Brucella intermedia 229E TaxID=1337887 RepID=U4VH82_9HYPH|nr:hypothetical protein Q644_02140 [Brucella intermedia 229E]
MTGGKGNQSARRNRDDGFEFGILDGTATGGKPRRGMLSREGVCDICAVDGRFAIMTTSSFAFSPPLRPVSYTGS